MARPKDRAERMAIVADMERKERAKRMGRNVAIGLVVVLVVAGAAYGISKIPSPPKSVHWHAKYEVWVNDQHLNFDSPRFSADRSPSVNFGGKLYEPAHLHAPSDIIHNEGKEGQGTMGKFFLYHLGGSLSNDEVVIPQGVLGVAPGPYKADANHSLQMWVDNTPYADQVNKTAPKSNWHRVSDLPDFSFHDGDRILLVYGDLTQTSTERLDALKAQYPSFNSKTVT